MTIVNKEVNWLDSEHLIERRSQFDEVAKAETSRAFYTDETHRADARLLYARSLEKLDETTRNSQHIVRLTAATMMSGALDGKGIKRIYTPESNSRLMPLVEIGVTESLALSLKNGEPVKSEEDPLTVITLPLVAVTNTYYSGEQAKAALESGMGRVSATYVGESAVGACMEWFDKNHSSEQSV